MEKINLQDPTFQKLFLKNLQIEIDNYSNSEMEVDQIGEVKEM